MPHRPPPPTFRFLLGFRPFYFAKRHAKLRKSSKNAECWRGLPPPSGLRGTSTASPMVQPMLKKSSPLPSGTTLPHRHRCLRTPLSHRYITCPTDIAVLGQLSQHSAGTAVWQGRLQAAVAACKRSCHTAIATLGRLCPPLLLPENASVPPPSRAPLPLLRLGQPHCCVLNCDQILIRIARQFHSSITH